MGRRLLRRERLRLWLGRRVRLGKRQLVRGKRLGKRLGRRVRLGKRQLVPGKRLRLWLGRRVRLGKRQLVRGKRLGKRLVRLHCRLGQRLRLLTVKAGVYLAFGGACVALVLFFHQGGGWNQNSRLLPVYAIVETGSLRADRWRFLTGDYAEIGGHVYGDKAPLASLSVLPWYWLWRHHSPGPQTAHDHHVALHIADLVAAAIPFSIFAVLLLARLSRVAPPSRAAWMALTTAFGTCLVCYGGMFFSHMLAATLFLAAYVLAIDRQRSFVLAGFLGAMAVAAEYPMVLGEAILIGYLAIGPDRRRRVVGYLLGAAPVAAFLLGYNRALTGGWFDLAYAHENAGFREMRAAFGLRLPSANALWELIFGQAHGVVFYAPALALFLPLLVLKFDGPRHRRNLVVLLLASHVLLISSYFMFAGGACVGPRHLAPVIALGCYEGVAALAKQTRWRLTFVVLSAWGIFLSLTAAATDAQPSPSLRSPAFEDFLPRLLAGHINAHNILVELGLPNGRYVVVAWFALLGVMGAAFSLWLRDGRQRGTLPGSAFPTDCPIASASGGG